jgi:uncharacterized protein (TIGR02246 family)
MTMNVLRNALLAVSLLTTTGRIVAQHTPTDEADIRSTILTMQDEWNRHDMAAYASHMTDDVEWVNVVGAWWKGKAQLQGTLDRYHKTIFKNRLLHDPTTLGFHEIAPGVVVATVIRLTDGYTGSDGKAIPAVSDILTLTFVKHAKIWLIAEGHNTSITESVAPKPQ